MNLLKSLITPRNVVQRTNLPRINTNRLPNLLVETVSVSPDSRSNDLEINSQRDEFKFNDEKIINRFIKSRAQKGVEFKLDFNSFKLKRHMREFGKNMQGYAKEIIIQTNKKMNLQVVKENGKSRGLIDKKRQGFGKFLRGVMSPIVRKNDTYFDMDDPLKSLIIKNSK